MFRGALFLVGALPWKEVATHASVEEVPTFLITLGIAGK